MKINRRDVIKGSVALTVLSILYSSGLGAAASLTSCGGGGGGGTGGTPTVPTENLTINSVSTAAPTALTALTMATTGLDLSLAFTVTLANSNGTGSTALVPLRTRPDGTVVVAMPLIVDGATGATTSFSGELTISQNGKTSGPTTISIADIPQLSDLGVSLGAISRAFYIHQQLATAGNLNVQQALSLLPKIAVKPSNVRADLQLQLTNAILARNDVDRIVTDNSTSIAIGTAADGTPLSFTSTSLELQDRIIGQYLLTSTNNGTAIPAKTKLQRPQIGKHTQIRQLGSEKFSIPPGSITQINQVISTASGWVGFKTGQQTLANADSSVLDNFLANASQYQTIAVLGTTAVALGAAAVGAPTVAALAGAALTYEALLGVAIGAAAIGNDLYNVATTGYDAYEASGTDTQANARFSSAVLALGTDAFTTAVSAVGVGAFASGSVTGNAAESVFQGLWGNVSAADATMGAAALAASTGNLYLQSALSTDSSATQDGLNQMSALQQSPQTGFGTVSGTVSIANGQGPILSGLTGVDIGDGISTFSGIADPSGTYDVLVPLGNPSIDYSQSTLSAYDPISGLVLSTEPIDLSTLTSTTVTSAPPVAGTCTDTDASTPDADDPDCD